MTGPSRALRVDLPHDPAAAPAARHHVRGALMGWSQPVIDDASLMVTEVVTNAVRHGRPPVHLAVSVEVVDRSARVAVADASPHPPLPRATDVNAEGGRGLLLVAALAERWGTERLPDDGKRVWFDVSDR